MRNPIGTHVLIGKCLVDGAVAPLDEPFILETPDSRDADNRDIPLLKRLRG